jgi:inosine-uridine nucleoside N-ribohydrolase
LLLAWGSPELDVLALTVIAGNAALADTCPSRKPRRLAGDHPGSAGHGSEPGLKHGD